MSRLDFLSSVINLTKSFHLSEQNELIKTPYPNVAQFTSHYEEITSIKEFHAALVAHSTKGHSLIKGKLLKELDKQSRAGSTNTDSPTWWICLDLDGAPYKTPKDFLNSQPLLKDLSCVVQYSASYGIVQSDKLSCHIFIMLDSLIAAPSIKSWLMGLNLETPALRGAITLSRTGAALHWPVDITACQNDKLIYIAPPGLGKGIVSSIKSIERIQLIPGKKATLNISTIHATKPLETWRKEARALLNDLRKKAGMDPLRSQTRWIGEYEVQAKPGEATITGKKEERGFVYLNLNGGDSWGYYHPEENFELIHNFKGEPAYQTKELLPGYYKDRVQAQRALEGTPTEEGEILLAFRHIRTSQYYNGVWSPKDHELKLYQANSVMQLDHFLQNHNRPGFKDRPVPDWDIVFNPQSSIVIDQEAKLVNRFIAPSFLRTKHKPAKNLDNCPTIKRIILSVVGDGKECDTVEHFLNWLAVIYQKHIKTKTAWLMLGTEGTGKQLLINKILAPTLGRENVKSRRMSELEEKYTAWLEHTLIGFVDEIEVGASKRAQLIVNDLKNFITDSPISIRHMNRVSYEADSYVNIIASANTRNCPVVIDPSDRRWNISIYGSKRLPMTDADVDTIAEELPAWMSYIMHRTADSNLAAQNIKNDAHKAMVEVNRTSLDVTALQIANGDLMELWLARPQEEYIDAEYGMHSADAYVYIAILKSEIRRVYKEGRKVGGITTHHSRLSREELRTMFEICVGDMPKSKNKFTSLLKHRNIITKRLMKNNKLIYGIDVEWRIESGMLKQLINEIGTQDTALRRVK